MSVRDSQSFPLYLSLSHSLSLSLKLLPFSLAKSNCSVERENGSTGYVCLCVFSNRRVVEMEMKEDSTCDW